MDDRERRFFGVKIDLVRQTGSSCPEPRFRKVVFPGGWNKDITLPIDPPMPPLAKKHHDFYQPLIEELVRSGFADRTRQNFGYTDRFFPSDLPNGVGYAVSLESGNSAWVTFHIQTGDNELNKRIFDELQAESEDIKCRIDAGPQPDWRWHRYDRYTFSSINIRTDGSIDDPPEKLEELRSWMLDLLPKFKEVFDPHVTNILSDR